MLADAAAKRKRVIVYGHEPAFPQGSRHPTDSLNKYEANRNAFWQLLADYDVLLYIHGHDHLADRFQVYSGYTDAASSWNGGDELLPWQMCCGYGDGAGGDLPDEHGYLVLYVYARGVEVKRFRDPDLDGNYILDPTLTKNWESSDSDYTGQLIMYPELAETDPNPSAEGSVDNPSAMQPDYINFGEDSLFQNPSYLPPYDSDPSAYVNIDYLHDTRFFGGQDYTYALWIKVHSDHATGSSVILADGLYRGWSLRWDNGTLSLVDNTAPSAPVASASLSPDTWYHVAFTFVVDDPSDSGGLYVDGELVDTFEADGFLSTDFNLLMGIDLIGSTYFQGWIKDVRVLDTALDAYGVWLIHNSGTPTFRKNFVIYELWKTQCEEITDWIGYNKCVGDCIANCATIPACSHDPSAWEADPSYTDYIYFYNNCRECWDYEQPQMYWRCVNHAMRPIPLYCNSDDEHIYRSKNQYDWVQQYHVIPQNCVHMWEECPEDHITYIWLCAELVVLSGSVKIHINGVGGETVTSAHNFRREWDLKQQYNLFFMSPEAWELGDEYRKDRLWPYLKVYDASEDAEWVIRVWAKCDVECVPERPDDPIASAVSI